MLTERCVGLWLLLFVGVLQKGQEVCREGEVGAEVYLVVDGKLAVETVKDGQVRDRQAGRQVEETPAHHDRQNSASRSGLITGSDRM